MQTGPTSDGPLMRNAQQAGPEFQSTAMHNALKQRIMTETSCKPYEILLAMDREQDAFDSEVLYNIVHKLPIEVQFKMQRGMQWINAFEGYNPILIGDAAEAIYSQKVKTIHPPLEYVMDSRYKTFKRYAMRECKKDGLIVVDNGDNFEIEFYGCRIFDKDTRTDLHNIQHNTRMEKIFGGKALCYSKTLVLRQIMGNTISAENVFAEEIMEMKKKNRHSKQNS